MDSEEAELAHEHVVGRLEHLGDQLAVLERLELDVVVLGPRAVAVDLRGSQAAVGQDVQQLLHPDVLAHREADDRNELAVGDGPGRGGLELGDGEFFAFEVAVHQVVVGLDDLLDDHLVGISAS